MKPPPGSRRSSARTLIIAALAIAVAAVAAIAWWSSRAAGFDLAPDSDRNVLLITIDTLRADAISAYGGRASTPRLDALAARGARFTFAHAHAVVTLPSHTSLLTGTYPYEHGVRDNNGYRVKADSTTLADETQEPRLRHRRVRRRLPPRPALRLERRFRRLRRSHRRDRQHSGLRATGAPRRRSSSRPRSPGQGRSRASGSRGYTSSIRTRRTQPPEEFARRYPNGPVRRRGRLDRLRPRRPVRSARRAAAQDARHRHRGSWREPRRPRRVDARHLRLRADAARATDRCRARAAGARATCERDHHRHVRSPRRHRADDSRSSRRTGGRDTARARRSSS